MKANNRFMNQSDNPFSKLSYEELVNRRKTVLFITSLLTAALAALVILDVFLIIKNGFTTLMVVPLGFSPILLLLYGQLKGIDKELKTRKENNNG